MLRFRELILWAIIVSKKRKGDFMSKVWLVTGSASGLGRNIAQAVLESGDSLVATARDPRQIEDLVQKYGDHVRAVPLDVADEGAAPCCRAGGGRRLRASRCRGEQRGLR